MQTLILTVVGAALATTVVMLLYMSFMSAERNGWRQLARRHGLRGRFDGQVYPFRTATMNGFAFHGILVMGVGDAGLMLRPIWLLRAFHPTLLLPWQQLRASRFQRSHDQGCRVTWRDPDGEPPLVLEWSGATQELVAAYLPAA